MTFPGDDVVGRVEFEAGVDTSNFQRELKEGVEQASDDIDADLKKTGKEWGDTTAKSMSKELGSHGDDFVDSIQQGMRRKSVKVAFEVDKEGNIGRRWISETFEEIKEAVDREGRKSGGGVLGYLGRGVGDAFGAGFNVSGRSSLIAVIIPLVGFIGSLIIALISALGPVAAFLAALPALLFAVGAQVGILMVAFNGLGSAIAGAFAAKNAKELNEALKDLVPSARNFVFHLLPLRDIFKDLQGMIQQIFFDALGTSGIDKLVAIFRDPQTRQGIANLTQALGEFAKVLFAVFTSPAFKAFAGKTLESTIRFLERFGPDLSTFLTGLLELATAALPFLEVFGKQLGGNLSALGVYFSNVAKDEDFQLWLERMSVTLNLVFGLIGSFIKFVATLIDTIDKAGGNKNLENLTENFERLTFLLASDVGIKGITGLINLFIFLSNAFFGLLFAVIIISAALREFFLWLGTIPGWLIDRWNELKEWWNELWRKFSNGPIQAVGNVVAQARALPGKIIAAVGNLGGLLLQAGRNLIQGLINGIKEKFGPLISVAQQAANIVASFWPFSPADQGPFSGHGAPVDRGRAIVSGIAEGMMLEAPQLRAASMNAAQTIVFGPGSIQANFNGALPSNSQAMSLGSALGSGINGQLAARDTRLAVRTL